MGMRRIVLVASVAYTILLLYASLAPQEAVANPVTNYSNGWLSHFAAYAIYAPLLLLNSSGPPSRAGILMCMLAALAVGTATETLQIYSPGRVADLGDWAFNAAGAGTGLVAATLLSQGNKTRVLAEQD